MNLLHEEQSKQQCLQPLLRQKSHFTIHIWKNFELISVHCFFNTNALNIVLSPVFTGIFQTNVEDVLFVEEMELLITVLMYIAANMMKPLASALMVMTVHIFTGKTT